jgi:hypothetical protein
VDMLLTCFTVPYRYFRMPSKTKISHVAFRNIFQIGPNKKLFLGLKMFRKTIIRPTFLLGAFFSQKLFEIF